MTLAAIVLAGGRSSRMGRDKAGLDWRGRPLVAHVASVLLDCVDGGPVVVVGPATRSAWARSLPDGVELVADEALHPGPVAGLAAGFAVLEERATRVLVAGTDQPFLTPATFGALLDATGTAAWRADGHLQPLGGVYAIGSVPADARRLTDLLDDATILDADATTARSLRSLDTPETYGAARELR